MKRRKSAAAILLLVSMLLTQAGIVPAWAAQGEPTTVTTAAEPAFAPLGEGASVVYERHEAGYQVTLNRTAEDATMTISTVPGSERERTAEKARLYLRTGVALRAGVAYRVGYTLTADQAQGYTLCLDGESENAYGAPQERSVKAGAADRARVFVTPEADGGELVLRLLVGKTGAAGNVLRLSDLTVEEASEAQAEAGTGKVLVDSLDYNAPGSITVWANDDSGAKLTPGEGSATLTVTQAPTGKVEVWKIKLLVHTGLNPEAGKTYRLKADVLSSVAADYEICYNEGDTEKGYDVLYNQKLTGKKQTLERSIYVPRDKESAGEIVLQLSLGKLPQGESVTISNIKVEEAATRYTNALRSDFAFDREDTENIYEIEKVPSSFTPQTTSINWSKQTAVTATGARHETPEVSGTTVTMAIKSTTDTDETDETGDNRTFEARLNIMTGVTLAADTYYRVSYTIKADKAYTKYEAKYGSGFVDAWDGKTDFGHKWDLALAENISTTVDHQFKTGESESDLLLQLLLGRTDPAGNHVEVSNITIQKLSETYVPVTLNPSFTYPNGNGNNGSFSMRDYDNDPTKTHGNLAGNESYAEFTCLDDTTGEWQRGLFASNICTALEAGDYQLSFSIARSGVEEDNNHNIRLAVFASESDKFADNGSYNLGDARLIWVDKANTSVTKAFPWVGSTLSIRLDLGEFKTNTKITISSIEVKKLSYTEVGTPTVISFDYSVWGEPNGCDIELTRNDDNAVFKVTPTNDDRKDWRAKLFIDTGFIPQPGKSYRVSFKIKGTAAQEKFHIFYGYGGSATEKIYGEKYNVPVSTTETTVTHDVSTNGGSGKLTLELLLGLVDGASNTFTVSGVQVEEITYRNVERVIESKTAGTSECALQEGYRGKLDRAKDHATLNILETPAKNMEAWKSKLFVDTGVQANADETFRVTMDVTAEKDMDFEVCYNRGETEKGFDAIYNLHAAAGTVKTVEKAFTAKYGGKIVIQLSLGNVPAANAVTVSNLRVERASHSYSGRSALPEPLRFTAASAVSYWAHGDYSTSLTGSEDAITMNILKAPATGAEPWKIKLFLDTGAVLEAGKYYKVTTDLVAQKAQTAEICYNNGGAEAAYDAQRGIALAAGEKKRVEKLISVPTTMTDASNLMLQVNLGGTDQPNAVTVSGITVEEVPVNYVDRAGQGMAYLPGQTVTVWNTDDYTTVLSENPDAAVLHVMEAPATGAEVWKVQLYVHTGAVLAPGKTYQVHANLTATRAQGYELCFNNEETEKGYDVLYGQQVPGGYPVSVDKKITVPADMTDAGELILQFSLGGPVRNDFLVSGVTVQELDFGENATQPGAPHTVVDLLRGQGAKDNTLDVTGERVAVHMAGGSYGALRVMGAGLRSADRYTVAFTAKADKPLAGEFAMMPQNGSDAVLYGQFDLSAEETAYAFTTPVPLAESGQYELRWLFAPEAAADVEISQVSVYVPAEELWVMPSLQAMTVNGVAVTPAAYAISGYNYVKLRDMALLLKGTQAQFVVRYNAQTDTVSITTGKEYTPIGGELAVGNDYSATCTRSVQSVTVNGKETKLKAYAIGGNNYFRIRDLAAVVGFGVDYDAATDTVVITSSLTPENMEATHNYQFFFRPEIDGESQPYVGDTMPFYEDGTYYIYYLKEGGDSYNHSVYLATTPDFVHYTEYDDPVLSASRADVQDSWIGTGSVVKAEGAYYFFYTGFNSSGSQEYHEKIMVAKGSTPTAFEKVAGWEIVPPAELNQKNDFRGPQAYYDPETGTISLTVTASQNGVAKILKYTVSPDLRSVSYDGPIFADPTGLFWNLECSDTFRMGDKWYLTYSAQEDTLWYASADSRFGPYSAPQRLEGKLFYAGKHVESETGSYMVGWVRRSNSASSTTEVNGWGGNMGVQRLLQKPDGSLTLAPVESVTAAFGTPKALAATEVSPAAGSFTPAFTCADSFLLKGQFTYTGTGSFGLAFDFNGNEEQYKLISLNPAEHKLSLSFQKGAVPISETQVELVPGQTYSFTYVQDGSIGTFYLDGQTALTVRLYGTTGKNICLFAENGGVTFTALEQFTR